MLRTKTNFEFDFFMQIIMTTEKITFNFTLRDETIKNVAKNTFNNYDINDIINIELLCNNYELSIDFENKSHQFFEYDIIYQHGLSNVNDLISNVIKEEISLKLALSIIKSIMKQYIACNDKRNYIESVPKLEIVASNYTCIFRDNKLTLTSDSSVIKYISNELMSKSLPEITKIIAKMTDLLQ